LWWYRLRTSHVKITAGVMSNHLMCNSYTTSMYNLRTWPPTA
jgi:hypothetical protein